MTHQTHNTFLHLHNAFLHLRIFAFHHASLCSRASLHFIAHHCVLSCIFAFHRASLCFIMHHHVLSCIFMFSRIFAFHHDLVHIIAGASIHCPASFLVCHIPFITISDYVWYCTTIISLWTLTLHHLHT
jgi:hypothetical protein